LELISTRGEVRNNIVIKNHSDGYTDRAGVNCSNSPVLIANNVIYGNTGKFGTGGGILIGGNLMPILKNNIITGNESYGIRYYGDLSLTYNNVYNNGGNDYVGCEPGIGSISESPLFVAPDNDNDPYNDDYHLQAGSLCIDAGDPDLVYNDIDDTRNDMGAYGGPHSF